jgi:hypothetical protein
MKRASQTILAVILIIAATLKVSAQTEQTRNVSGFSSIASGGPFNVHVKIDGTESLKISASQDVMDEIQTVVENGKLEIKFKNSHYMNHENIGTVDVYVTAKSLSSLANAGSGSIKVDGTVTGENVSITLSGAGNITSSIKSGKLHASISGSGSIHLDGSADEVKVSISGSGEMRGKELKAGSASVSITGSGNVYLAADKDISAHIIGSGSVVYSVNATVSDSKTIGSGEVRKEK